jgi:putative ABC transport system ATP-binding protein
MPIPVHLAGVTYAYGKGELRRPVLRDVDLSSPRARSSSHRPSGSGKTTLLTLIGALRAMQDGSCRVLGVSCRREGGARVRLRRRIGFIFQHHNLLGFLTARQNVAMALEQDGSTTDRQRLSRAGDLLAGVGLADHADKVPGAALRRAAPARLGGARARRRSRPAAGGRADRRRSTRRAGRRW